MEEFLIVVFHFIYENILQALLEVFGEWAVLSSNEKTSTSIIVMIFAIILGAGIGLLSVQIFPESLIGQSWLRCLNLVVAPLIALYLSRRIAKLRGVDPSFNKQLFSVIFTFTLVSIRLSYIQ